MGVPKYLGQSDGRPAEQHDVNIENIVNALQPTEEGNLIRAFINAIDDKEIVDR